jgi:hypothetical protein
VATTANIDKTARTAREIAETQRDSFEALAENFAVAQRRGIGLANEGLEFMKLQEDNARAAQEWFANGVKLLQLQGRNAGFVQDWVGEAAEVLRKQTEQNVRTAEAIACSVSRQQEAFRALTQGWVRAYGDFFSPFALVQQGMRAAQRTTRQGLEATEEAARQGLRATEQVTEQGLRIAEEAAEQTKEVLREAELRAAVLAALQTTDYDGLTVAEIFERLDGLTVHQLEQVRELEKNKSWRRTTRTARPSSRR